MEARFQSIKCEITLVPGDDEGGAEAEDVVWDAFYDCLTDMDSIDAQGYVIYFDHTDAFAGHHESQLETVVELFQDAVDFWKTEGKPMLVVLSGTHSPPGMKKI